MVRNLDLSWRQFVGAPVNAEMDAHGERTSQPQGPCATGTGNGDETAEPPRDSGRPPYPIERSLAPKDAFLGETIELSKQAAAAARIKVRGEGRRGAQP